MTSTRNKQYWGTQRVARVCEVSPATAVHGLFVRYVRDFDLDRNRRSAKFYRIINEVPTVLMIGIVLLAVLKPF